MKTKYTLEIDADAEVFAIISDNFLPLKQEILKEFAKAPKGSTLFLEDEEHEYPTLLEKGEHWISVDEEDYDMLDVTISCRVK